MTLIPKAKKKSRLESTRRSVVSLTHWVSSSKFKPTKLWQNLPMMQSSSFVGVSGANKCKGSIEDYALGVIYSHMTPPTSDNVPPEL
jgi:hypothetical protein